MSLCGCRLEAAVQLWEAAGQRRRRLPLTQWTQVRRVPALTLSSTRHVESITALRSAVSSRPSPVLLSCGVPPEVAANALRLSVGRRTSKRDVDAAVEDLREAVLLLEALN